MRHLLAELYDSSPCIGCEALRTIWTLVVCDNIFNLEGLLEDGPLKRFLLNSDFYFDPPRMGFCPNKASIYNPGL